MFTILKRPARGILLWAGFFTSLLLLTGCNSDTDTSGAVSTSTPAAVTADPGPTEASPPEPTPVPDPLVAGTAGFPWWNDTVFYEVFVRSFYDSDGDGVGDINGLIEKLDYLNDGDPTTTDDLGITGIWLMPVMESTSYHGYDVVDYYQIDEAYGTNEDFQRLIDEAHARGIRVIIDLVINHTGVEHPWFVESRDPAAEKRDWYLWSDSNPGFQGPDGQVVWHQTPSGYYYGVFWDGMPDLNFANPDVTATIEDVTRFWAEEMNVDGFRLDAIKHLIEDGDRQENTPLTHAWFEAYHDFYKRIDPELFAVGEAWTATREIVNYTGDEVDIAFEFDLALSILSSARSRNARAVATKMAAVVRDYPPLQYATFLTNHDQNRVMSTLDNSEPKARAAATILLTSPGVPFIYYGEEIGMTGVKPDEDIRRPMQWNGDSIRVGFTDGVPWRAPAGDYPDRNVALQTDDPDSLLSHYRRLIALRNEHEALRVGDWIQVGTNAPDVYAYLRQTADETILVVVNLDSAPVSTGDYALELESSSLVGPLAPVSLLGPAGLNALTLNDAGGFADYVPVETLDAQGSVIILLQ